MGTMTAPSISRDEADRRHAIARETLADPVALRLLQLELRLRAVRDQDTPAVTAAVTAAAASVDPIDFAVARYRRRARIDQTIGRIRDLRTMVARLNGQVRV